MLNGEDLKIERTAKTLRELALEKVRDAILGFQFRPGERLVERTLCERLGVSRTVVREVLRHLETEGLVQSVAHHGPIVARPDPSNAAEIYEIRALLEGEAARSCALKATDGDVTQLRQAIDRIEQAFAQASPRDVLRATTDFYELFFTCANKLVAWHVVQLLNGRINHLRAMTIATPGRDMAAISEMRRILNAIERKDGDAAYAASVNHVNSVAELAQRVLAQSAAADVSPLRERAGVLPVPTSRVTSKEGETNLSAGDSGPV